MANTNPFDFLGLDDHEEEAINPRIQAQLGDLLKELNIQPQKPIVKPTSQPPKQDKH